MLKYDRAWWMEVKRLMIENFYRSPEDAAAIIKLTFKNYKARKVSEILYHDNPLHEAEALSHWKLK